jgi:uncharacterized protein
VIAHDSIEATHPTVCFRNSRFLHLLSNRNHFCLLHSLTTKKVYGGKILEDLNSAFSQPTRIDEVYSTLSRKYPMKVLVKAIDDLIEKGLVIPDEQIDLQIYLQLFKQGMDQNQIQHLYLIPTTECNLRCKYCFVEDENRKFTHAQMTKETARKSLEVFAKLSENATEISVTFYGGEPLLNAEIVYFALRQIRALEMRGSFKKPVDITLFTNGLLVDDETVKVLFETRASVSISIDGPKRLHDAARVGPTEKGTFDKAMTAYRKLKAAGINPSVSCTLNRHNVGNIQALIGFIVDELKPATMGFNILLPQVNGKNFADVPPQLATQALISAFKVLREQGIYEDRVMRHVKAYIGNAFHCKDCMGVGGQIVITPQGRIGPCQALLGIDKYFPQTVDKLYSQILSINSDYVYKDVIFDEWLQRFPLNMKQCIDCFAIAVCGGGCPYASKVMSGSIWQVDERACSQAKQIMEWMIWETYDRLVKEELEDA